MYGTYHLQIVSQLAARICLNKNDTYLRRVGYTELRNCWSLDKPMYSLSICHLPWMAILFDIAKLLFTLLKKSYHLVHITLMRLF